MKVFRQKSFNRNPEGFVAVDLSNSPKFGDESWREARGERLQPRRALPAGLADDAVASGKLECGNPCGSRLNEWSMILTAICRRVLSEIQESHPYAGHPLRETRA